MTPKFRGVAEKLKKLQHHLDHEAGKLDARIDQTMARSHGVFEKSHKTVAQSHEHLDGIDDFLTDLEKSNAGPPLDDSSPESAPRSTEVATRKGT